MSTLLLVVGTLLFLAGAAKALLAALKIRPAYSVKKSLITAGIGILLIAIGAATAPPDEVKPAPAQ
jgi:hypothetical protein